MENNSLSRRDKKLIIKYKDARNYLFCAKNLISNKDLNEIQPDTYTESFIKIEILKDKNYKPLCTENIHLFMI